MSRRAVNWTLLLAPFVPAFAAANVMAFAVASGDDKRMVNAIVVWGVVTLVSLVVSIIGGLRILRDYKRSGRVW
jgi:hypothetical protein